MDYSRDGKTPRSFFYKAPGVLIGFGCLYWFINAPTVDLSEYRKTEGCVQASALARAVEIFYREYNRLPDVPARMQTDTGSGVKLLKTLRAEEGDHPGAENSRQVVFLEVKQAKGNRGGLVFESETSDVPLGMFDSYGHPFHVILNKSYSPELEFEYGRKKVKLPGKMAAVYSAGKDGKIGTKDDSKSW